MLLDISLVTQTLMNVIDKFIGTLPPNEKSKVSPWNVSALPPDKLTGDRTIGIYLYHVVEDAQFKNMPPLSPDVPPIRFTHMGLDLFYQLSAHSELLADAAPETEQTLMGFAIKALRDYASIDDSTFIGGLPVFPLDLQGTDNRFHVDLLMVQPEQAVNYWTAGSHALRLSAYYRVSVVLLQPDKPQLRSGRVLLYGIYTFLRGSPRLDGSRSTIVFRLPSESSNRTAEAIPGEAPVGGAIQLFGSDLSGDITTVLVNGPGLPSPYEAASDWGVTAVPDKIFLNIAPRAGLTVVVPGMFSAIAKVTEQRVMPDKTVRSFSKTSNQVAFFVTPAITKPIPPPNAQGVVALAGGVFQDPAIPGDGVQVFVGPTALTPKPAGPLNPGQYEIVDASHLRFRYPVPGVASGDTVALRVIVNGAESAPNWVQAP